MYKIKLFKCVLTLLIVQQKKGFGKKIAQLSDRLNDPRIEGIERGLLIHVHNVSTKIPDGSGRKPRCAYYGRFYGMGGITPVPGRKNCKERCLAPEIGHDKIACPFYNSRRKGRCVYPYNHES